MKFLLSLILVIAALTFSTLLIVGHSAEGQVQKAIEQDTRNSGLTFENIRAERQLELSRNSELISTSPAVKALMADSDAASMDDERRRVGHPQKLNFGGSCPCGIIRRRQLWKPLRRGKDDV